jgi:hypothetical protein
VASAVRVGARVRAVTMDAVKHVSQIAPFAGEANCRARHSRWERVCCLRLLRLGLQVGVYSYSAACDHHPLFPRLIAPLLHDDLMVTCRHTHNRCRVAHENFHLFRFPHPGAWTTTSSFWWARSSLLDTCASKTGSDGCESNCCSAPLLL